MLEIMLDSGDAKKIEELVTAYNIQAVTCNPSILIKDKSNIKDLIKVVPRDTKIFVQVIAEDEEGMIKETKALMGLRDKIIVKIPATPTGMRAIKRLKDEGIETLATAIYSVQQAVMAANCGAAYVAPYVNRICDSELDGIQVALDIKKIFDAQSVDCQVIAASFKNVFQVKELMAGGIGAITLGVDLLEKMIINEKAVEASHDFAQAWEDYTGQRALNI